MVNLDPILGNLIGESASRDQALDALEFHYARLAHVSKAKSLFGILDVGVERLVWCAGGTDVGDLLGSSVDGRSSVSTLDALLSRLGVSGETAAAIRDRVEGLSPGKTIDFAQRLPGTGNRSFSIVFQRYSEEDGGMVQFTLSDNTGFVQAERDVRNMAAKVVSRMGEAESTGKSALEHLSHLENDFHRLVKLASDTEVALLAGKMSREVGGVARRAVKILQRFESGDPYDATLPLPPPQSRDIGIQIPRFSLAVDDWDILRDRIAAIVDGKVTPSADELVGLLYADSFVRHAVPILIYAIPKGNILVLNGTRAGTRYPSIADLARGIGIEENSVETATGFFGRIGGGHVSTTFAMEDHNIEARGHPTAIGGWQAMILPASTQTVDVRGLFHGFKNLLLNLQVLYVVKSTGDIGEVGGGIREAFDRIRERLGTLRAIAETGGARIRLRPETVDRWIEAARRVAAQAHTRITVSVEDQVGGIRFDTVPGAMEDVLGELARNAAHHGAETVSISARRRGDHMVIAVGDDGDGMSEDKLRRLKTVIHTRNHDHELSTRRDGSGHGLLGAANTLARFLDSTLAVVRNPEGRGIIVNLTMKVPPEYRRPRPPPTGSEHDST